MAPAESAAADPGPPGAPSSGPLFFIGQHSARGDAHGGDHQVPHADLDKVVLNLHTRHGDQDEEIQEDVHAEPCCAGDDSLPEIALMDFFEIQYQKQGRGNGARHDHDGLEEENIDGELPFPRVEEEGYRKGDEPCEKTVQDCSQVFFHIIMNLPKLFAYPSCQSMMSILAPDADPALWGSALSLMMKPLFALISRDLPSMSSRVRHPSST